MKVRVPQALYFHLGSYVFIVTSEAQCITHLKSAVCFLLSDPVLVIKLCPYLPFHSRVTFSCMHLLLYESCVN